MGHRYYKDSDIEILKKIKILKEHGYQLKAIKMLLANLEHLESLDNQTIVKLKDELNGKVIDMWKDDNNLEVEQEEGTSIVSSEENNEIKAENQDKMQQFKAIMNQIVMSALKENNTQLSEEISTNVTSNVIKEMNYLMRLQEEREEERYRKFDATLRDYQKVECKLQLHMKAGEERNQNFLKRIRSTYKNK